MWNRRLPTFRYNLFCLQMIRRLICSWSIQEYRQAISRVADSAGDFFDVVVTHTRMRDGFSISVLLQELFRGLPEVCSLSSLITLQHFFDNSFRLFSRSVLLNNRRPYQSHLPLLILSHKQRTLSRSPPSLYMTRQALSQKSLLPSGYLSLIHI